MPAFRTPFARRTIWLALALGLNAAASRAVAETPSRPLETELAEKAKEAETKTPAEARAIMTRAIEDVEKGDVLKKAAKVGDTFPAFELKSAGGKTVSLAEATANGPAVITFYRGGWCPYCNLQLRAYEKSLADFKKRGATLVAVSPEKPDDTLSTKQKAGLDFAVLSDPGNGLADKAGLVYKVPPDLKALYRKFGVDLAKSQGNDDWRLPIAATYVVDRHGVITWRFVSADYRKRAEPADVVAALDQANAKAQPKG